MAQSLIVGDHEVSQQEVEFLKREGIDYCFAHGMVYKDSNGKPQHIPFTLFPSPFLERLFTAAKEVQTDFNLLVHKVSQDYEFTKNALSSTVAADPFTSRLFDIYEQVFQQGSAQSISLGIFRSDYMAAIDIAGALHGKCQGCSSKNNNNNNISEAIYIKQVEMNTIAVGGVSTSSLHVPGMYRYLLHLVGQENKVPPNPAIDEKADGLIRAWELYGSQSAVIMFIVQPGEMNIYDQRLLEYRIYERDNRIKVIRRSLTDIFNDGKTDNGKSFFVNGLEVAVAYYRAGYTPKDYPTENEWSARLTLELSRCIKCPTVAHQLMGTKKMQQVVAEPGVLERFLPDKESVDRVRRTFTGLYTLDPGPEGDRNVECCLQMVDKCVLKPQREGGGNNIYDEDIRRTLLDKSVNRSQYILMDRLQPQINKNFIVRHESTTICPVDVIPEIGIMGIFISRDDDVLVNKEGGYHVRSKTTEHADGGVLAGRAAFDSVYIV